MHVCNEYKIYHFCFIYVLIHNVPTKFFFLMGNVTKRLFDNKVSHEKLIITSNGLQDDVKNITSKISLFPFFVSKWKWCIQW